MSDEIYQIVPLMLNGQLSDIYNNSEILLLWHSLEQGLNAKIVALEDLKNYQPILFLVYFDEAYSDLNEELYEKIYTIPWSVSVFFIKSGNDHKLYKPRIEEEYLLNFTKEFLLYDLNLNPSIFSSQIIHFCNKQLYFFKKWDTNKFKILNSDLGKNKFLQYNFLRIYREDLSAASFYACIEFILMLQHFFLLLDIAQIENLKLENQQKINFLTLNNRGINDNIIFSYLKIIQGHIQYKSFSYDFLQKPMDVYSNSLFDEIIKYYEMNNNGEEGLKKWINVFEVMVEIRNKTKGHGIVYDVSKIQELMLEMCNNLLYNLPEIRLECINKKLICYKPYMRFADINEIFKIELKSNRFQIRSNSYSFEVNPYILFSENYGMFLYEGYTSDNKKVIYKNHSQGINLEI